MLPQRFGRRAVEKKSGVCPRACAGRALSSKHQHKSKNKTAEAWSRHCRMNLAQPRPARSVPPPRSLTHFFGQRRKCFVEHTTTSAVDRLARGPITLPLLSASEWLWLFGLQTAHVEGRHRSSRKLAPANLTSEGGQKMNNNGDRAVRKESRGTRAEKGVTDAVNLNLVVLHRSGERETRDTRSRASGRLLKRCVSRSRGVNGSPREGVVVAAAAAACPKACRTRANSRLVWSSSSSSSRRRRE